MLWNFKSIIWIVTKYFGQNSISELNKEFRDGDMMESLVYLSPYVPIGDRFG